MAMSMMLKMLMSGAAIAVLATAANAQDEAEVSTGDEAVEVSIEDTGEGSGEDTSDTSPIGEELGEVTPDPEITDCGFGGDVEVPILIEDVTLDAGGGETPEGWELQSVGVDLPLMGDVSVAGEEEAVLQSASGQVAQSESGADDDTVCVASKRSPSKVLCQ